MWASIKRVIIRLIWRVSAFDPFSKVFTNLVMEKKIYELSYYHNMDCSFD